MEKQENIIATYQQIIQETAQQLQKARKRISGRFFGAT